ncbi:MAG: hypothetical protein DRO04_00745 [Candidatus Iainarchaeum archaeon]|uniref:dolichyl-phosphooligosaccharide-protein glycotransferase n=1 Tax=Candidatus Iainarchaeum sp. TaxID=3101447 RepID=A0A497JI34_9ARCH|nr:MAG: hypothetical protein DRO04_00745 [Candidatus Diapherotrites archaeon]
MVKLKSSIQRGKAIFKKFAKFLAKLSNPKLMTIILLLLFYTLSALLRAMPARWGIYLNEFDPFYEYYVAKKILSKGFIWWFQWHFESPQQRMSEVDKLFWYPYGRDIRASSPPGISMTSALIYLILQTLGFRYDLYVIHAFIPVFFAPLTVIIVYLLGKKVRDEFTGLLSAFFLSLSSAFISRTMLGGKHESIAIPFMLFSFLLYLIALSRGSQLSKIFFGVFSGFFLGLTALSWGGFLYPWNLIALYTIVLIVVGQFSNKDSIAYIAYWLVSSIIIAITPRYGFKMAFLSFGSLLPLVATIASISILFRRTWYKVYRRTWFRIGFTAGLIILGLILWRIGLLANISSRILSIIFPQRREAIIESVAEHRPSSWAMLFSDYGVFIPISLAGVYLVARKRKREDWFLILYYATGIYAATSFARLTLISSPIVFLLAAIALSELMESFTKVLIGKIVLPKRFRKRLSTLKEASAIGLLAIVGTMILGTYGLTQVFAYSHSPPLILTSSYPVSGSDYNYQYIDWISALDWMRNNLPENAVIASWWDYGYWIAVNTNRSSVCDNATINSTQIALIARAFLSSEEEAIKIFERLKVTHVVVFDPFYGLTPGYGLGKIYMPQPQGVGDFGKSYWMAKIAGLDPNKYITTAKIRIGNKYYQIIVPADTPEARNATLYHLLFIKVVDRYSWIFEPIPYYPGNQKWPFYDGPLVRIPPPKYFKLVYVSRPNGWVLVYEIRYPREGQ